MGDLSARMRYRCRLAAATLLVAVVHAAVIGLLCLTPPRGVQAAPDPGRYSLSVSLVDGASAPVATTAPPAAKAEKPRSASTDLTVSVSAEGQASAVPQLSTAEAVALAAFHPDVRGDGQDQDCDLTEALNAAFTASSAVHHSLQELPTSQRSVANAVMLWDGQWSQDSVSGGKALLRALLIKAVAGARPECLSAVNHGPVLFYVPDATSTFVIAVGSGQWRWGDLMAPSAASIIS